MADLADKISNVVREMMEEILAIIVIEPPTSFECGCCFEQMPVAEGISCNDGHIFCFGCIKNSIQSFLFGGIGSSPNCLAVKCNLPYEIQRIKCALDQKMIGQLETEEQKRMIVQVYGAEGGTDVLHHCPFCGFTCLIDKANQVFKCFECKKDSCQYCRVEWGLHVDFGYVCDEVETHGVAQLRIKAEEEMTKAMTRFCPGCGKTMIKDGGCHNIHCPCGTSFCNICSRVGCPGCSSMNDAQVMARDHGIAQQARIKGEADMAQLGYKGDKRIGGDA